jgi:tubulin-specific chaperone A
VTQLYSLNKEHQLYRSEAVANKAKLDRLKEEGTAEEWDIKNAVSDVGAGFVRSDVLKTKLLEESNRMIVDSAERLDKARDELSALIVSPCSDTHFYSATETAFSEDTARIG